MVVLGAGVSSLTGFVEGSAVGQRDGNTEGLLKGDIFGGGATGCVGSISSCARVQLIQRFSM